MSGISSAIRSQTMASFLDIIVEEKEYSIGWSKFKSEATNPFLLECTKQVLEAFRQLEWTINKQKSIDIDEDTCNEQLATLATWGQRAYEKFFDTPAQTLLLNRFQMMKAMNAGIPSPTFISDMVPFPWEVLYEGDADVINKEQFWGLGYAPARILDKRDIAQYVWEQTLPSDMLFCLHHKLRYTHQRE